MPSDIFKTLIEREIDIFAATFSKDSNSLFKGSGNILIHPGEYGMYRERCLKNILQKILPKNYSISDGFIITSKNSVSTQCDLLIHDSQVQPIIDNNLAKFFPVEDICGIIEVKSDLSKAAFTYALKKLANTKKLQDQKCTYTVPHNQNAFLNFDYIPSFLVCNKLKFDVTTINFEEIYNGIDRKYWHSIILSLGDGISTYHFKIADFQETNPRLYTFWKFERHVTNVDTDFFWTESTIAVNSSENEKLIQKISPTQFEIDSRNKYHHVLLFLSGLLFSTSSYNKPHTEVGSYLGMTASFFDKNI